jgi:hypothetical protein
LRVFLSGKPFRVEEDLWFRFDVINFLRRDSRFNASHDIEIQRRFDCLFNSRLFAELVKNLAKQSSYTTINQANASSFLFTSKKIKVELSASRYDLFNPIIGNIN